MRKFRYILLLVVASAVWGCQKFNDGDTTASTESLTVSNSIVEVLADGRYQVTAQLEGVSMTSVTTRASASEDVIRDGWCLVFGEDQDNFYHGTSETTTTDAALSAKGLTTGQGTGEYSDNSPLIEIERVTINANGTFVMVFDEFPHTAFMRIVVNMTDREDENLEDNITSWRMACTSDGVLSDDFAAAPPTFDEVSTNGIATFGHYRHQSVGLDGIYQMTYSTDSEIVECISGGFESYNIVYNTDGTIASANGTGIFGFKDAVDYTDYGNPIVTSVVDWSVQYTTSGGKVGTSTVTGLEETYNQTQPNPAAPLTTGFPMSSYGIMMDDGITETSLNEAFGSIVYMIRACSKVAVNVVDSDFEMKEVYLIDAAQEARIRSTVISGAVTDDNDNTTVASTTLFSIPVDLGGTITYQGLSTSGTTSDPIYFYPNSGGGYIYNDGSVYQDVNPQYVIIKGRAAGYDTDGYYKVALKAQYPLSDLSTESNMDDATMWSSLTYDILRNTSFTINLNLIDKPGYKTLADAENPEAPANNISYSIDIETSDNQYEVLVSKGTYYAELESSRVYVKGYMEEGIEGCYVDFTLTTSAGNTTPSIYIQSSDFEGDDDDDDNVTIERAEVLTQYSTDGTWTEWTEDDWESADDYDLVTNTTDDGLSGMLVNIPRSEAQEDSANETKRKVRVYFSAKGSGRVCLRIGDILKFIPVLYDSAPVSMYGTAGQDGSGTGVVVSDESIGRSWSDFSYSAIVQQSIGEYGDDYSAVDDLVDYNNNAFGLQSDGTIIYSNEGQYDIKPELRARIYPSDAGDGIAVLYLRQASDFALQNGDNIIDDDFSTEYTNIIEYTAQSKVYNNDTQDLFSTKTNSDGTQYVEFTTISSGVTALSVDALTITTDNVDTTVDNNDNAVEQTNYWNEVNDGTTLQLSATAIAFDFNTTYTEFSSDFIQYDNKATTTITLTNSAGDTKNYTVYQVQHPPVYLVTNNYGTTKTYAMCYWSNIFSTRSITEDGCVIYAVNIYNYSDSANSGYTYSTSLVTSGSDSDEMDIHLYPTFFGSSFVNSYNYSSGDVSTAAITSGKNNNGSTVSYLAGEVNEFNTQGGNVNADVAIGVIRNYDDVDNVSWSYNAYSATGNLTVAITDKYGDTYTTTKTFSGI
ncbi:MAG: hypothetical protein SNH63_06755 [Rikenellaceae bacterium]